MINRIKRIMDNAHYAKYNNSVDINVTAPSFENAMAVEGMKEDTVHIALKALTDELVEIRQDYPENFISTINGEIDVVLFKGRDFRELKKLLDGLHEIWIQKQYSEKEQARAEV